MGILQLKNQFVRILGLCALLTLVACSNSINNNSGGAPSSLVIENAITIDNAGVIPVFSNKPSSTLIYVHNNSSTTISNIKYSIVNTNDSANVGLLDGSQCSSIAAAQGCALQITTPNLTMQQNQGSMLIKADYQVAKQMHSFSQLINYAAVDTNANQNGVKFKSGATIYGYGHSIGYATLYLYTSGMNQNYTITEFNINQPSLKFNPNLSGLTLSANSVQAVEISSPILQSSISAIATVQSNLLQPNMQKLNSDNSDLKSLKVNKSLQSNNSSDSVSISVEPSAAGAILTSGFVPLINTASATGTSATMLIQNAGNQVAEVGSVSADVGITNLSGCSNTTLTPGGVCSITFNVTESGGSGNITVEYTGGSNNSISGNVTWFNGAGAALVGMSIENNPLSFSATVGATTQVTVTNLGGYTLNNIVIPSPRVVGGSATAEILSGVPIDECVTGGELAVGGSCSYSVAVNDSQTDLNQQINLGFQASYAGASGIVNYSRVVPLTYSSTSYGAIIVLSPLSAMSISGDNLESATQELTISNNGAATADLTSLGLINNPAYLTANNGNCSSSLAAESSCTAQIKLGPVSGYLESSGVANYVVNYAAVGQTSAGIESTSVAWSVAPNLPIITMDTTVTGCASGDGITTTCMANPTATGGSSSSIQVVLTFTNSSSVTATTTISLPESSSSLFTVPGYSLFSNSCTNGAAANNGSCTIIYTLPSSATTTAFQSSLNQANFAYNYTYGTSSEVSASGTSNLATTIDVVMPALAIESINNIAQGESGTATINWSNLYQATVPTTTTSATKANGTSATGLSSATPATCGSVVSNMASCTSLITTTSSTPVVAGYLLKVAAAGGLSATPESFTVFSNRVIFVTSVSWNGDLGGFAGADTKCNGASNKPKNGDAGTGKTYKALLNSNNATVSGRAYYRTDGLTLIATANGGNLVGSSNLASSISTTAGVTPWTGVSNSNNCANFTSTDAVNGNTGISNSVTSSWWSGGIAKCILSRPLYCVAQ